MKYKITESRFKEIIAENVRKYLFETDGDTNVVIDQLKQPGINQAEVARDLIKTVWTGMDIDTARSLLSKKVRGEISMTEEEKNAIKRSLETTIRMS